MFGDGKVAIDRRSKIMCWCKFNFRYEEENLKLGRKKTNVMFIGDGKGKTVITGGRNYYQNLTTFHTASFGKFFLLVLSLVLIIVL